MSWVSESTVSPSRQQLIKLSKVLKLFLLNISNEHVLYLEVHSSHNLGGRQSKLS